MGDQENMLAFCSNTNIRFTFFSKHMHTYFHTTIPASLPMLNTSSLCLILPWYRRHSYNLIYTINASCRCFCFTKYIMPCRQVVCVLIHACCLWLHEMVASRVAERPPASIFSAWMHTDHKHSCYHSQFVSKHCSSSLLTKDNNHPL